MRRRLAQIEQDLRYLCVFHSTLTSGLTRTHRFTDTGHWLSFLNYEHFRETLLDAEARVVGIHPALVYAGLAMATLMKSSEAEYKAPGRERALWLRDTAATCIQSSISAEWVDASLAQAALILALFESSAHPMYSPDRVEAALVTLDYVIRTTRLTTIDADDADVLTYAAGRVPMAPGVGGGAGGDNGESRKCGCIPADATQTPDAYSSWTYIPAWDARWTAREMRNEECRRLCWAALSLVCNYVSQCVAFDREPPELFILDCANYAILFPGEALDRVSPSFRASTASTKESVWALYCRSMLLWNFTNRLRTRIGADDGEEDKVEMVYDAWAEAQALQDGLRAHTCNLDTVLMYMCREYVYK
ncbi:hypothetical protein C0992_010937 [Termitomyces sp. T32_za158]|nr:hypothetical protein C0992_010937 [Termitomyces sp. T32_za158]